VKLPVILLAAALLAAGCSGEQDPRVQVAEVVRATVAEVVDAPGTVGARATSSLTAPADATVAEVLVPDGAQVEKGAVLARLSSPAAQDRLKQALAARANASDAVISVPQANLSPLQDQVDAAAAASFAAGRTAVAQIPDPALRAQAEQRATQAERQYAAAAAAARAALAQLGAGADGVESALAAVTGSQRAQAGAAVTVARQTVEALTVRAPISGVVTLGAGGAAAAPSGAGDLAGLISGLPPAAQGPASEALGAGVAGGGPAGGTTTMSGLVVGAPVRSGAPLLTVTDLGGLTVDAEVDETDVLLVQAGTPATSARGGVSYRVRLALLGGTTADDQPAPQPRPGMSAVVDLQVRTAENALAVPAAAVVRDEGRDAVFVIEQGRAIRREVRLGAQGADLVEVVAGLLPGAQVVVRDADRLRDGQAVRT
jgi:multidrug efflux pump subunit AcrA (membrane-fusion protein)